MADHAFEWDDQPATPDRKEARQQLGHLDPREALVAGLRIANEDAEAQRERRDVRKRLTRADCERRQDREDVGREAVAEVARAHQMRTWPQR